jgi:hypothetical protein
MTLNPILNRIASIFGAAIIDSVNQRCRADEADDDGRPSHPIAPFLAVLFPPLPALAKPERRRPSGQQPPDFVKAYRHTQNIEKAAKAVRESERNDDLLHEQICGIPLAVHAGMFVVDEAVLSHQFTYDAEHRAYRQNLVSCRHNSPHNRTDNQPVNRPYLRKEKIDWNSDQPIPTIVNIFVEKGQLNE